MMDFRVTKNGWYDLQLSVSLMANFFLLSFSCLYLFGFYFPHNLAKRYFVCHLIWQAEVNFLGDLIHPNLVKLIGYCIEDDQRLLVYEFMPRGSLENHLFRSRLSLLVNCYRSLLRVGLTRKVL